MTHERRERKLRFGWLELFLAVAVVALAGQLGWLAWQTSQNRPRPGVQVARRFGATGYLLYLPREYRRQSSWPLLVYLHGAGERGTEPARLAEDCGPPGQIERGRDFPMIVASPQCPPGRRFDAAEILALVDHIMGQFHVDGSRVYLTGYSMGGRGTWDTALRDPAKFAAIAPLCGVVDPGRAEALKDLPIWAFHGAKDQVVPLASSRTMIDAIRAAGGDARMTVYPEHGHGICGLAYGDPALYNWLLSQRRVPR